MKHLGLKITKTSFYSTNSWIIEVVTPVDCEIANNGGELKRGVIIEDINVVIDLVLNFLDNQEEHRK